MKLQYKEILVTFIVALMLTLITGMVPNTGGLMGVGFWGFPLPWRSQMTYPGSVMNLDFATMLIDLIFWWFVIYMIYMLALRYKIFDKMGFKT
jgi:hypothetical protein